MNTIYVPRLIESAEQAEALPPGTVALERGEQGQTIGASIRVRDGWHITGGNTVDGSPHLYKHGDMVGDQALVPIEAEEELRRTYALPASTFPGLSWPEQRDEWKRRLVTPWETE